MPSIPRLLPLLWCALVFSTPIALGAEPDAPSGSEWKQTSRSNGVTIYTRVRTGSPIKEFKGVGQIDAPAQVVSNVLDDIESYPKFMPYMIECRVLSREADSLVSYQHISPPFCSDRDYTLRVRHTTQKVPSGTSFVTRWELANALGPAENPKMIRVKVNEGSWTVEPASDTATRATYCIYTDSGGALPAFIANKANQVAIGKLFEAVRKQAKDPKYRTPARP